MIPLALTAAGIYSWFDGDDALCVSGVFFSLFLFVIYMILNNTRKEKPR